MFPDSADLIQMVKSIIEVQEKLLSETKATSTYQEEVSVSVKFETPVSSAQDIDPFSSPFDDFPTPEEIERARESRIRAITTVRKKEVRSEEQETKIMGRLKKALDELDKPQLEALLSEARKIHMSDGTELQLARDICFSMSDGALLDLKLKKALIEDKVAKLKSLVAQAIQMGYESLTVREAKKRLTTLGYSTKHELSAGGYRDYTRSLQSMKNLYPLSSLPSLRTPQEFTKRGFFSISKSPETDMFKFSSVRLIISRSNPDQEPIARSMFNFHVIDKPKANKLNDLAVLAFKDILSFTKARFHSFAETVAHQLIQRGVQEPLLRDELYAQIIKQTTSCPSK